MPSFRERAHRSGGQERDKPKPLYSREGRLQADRVPGPIHRYQVFRRISAEAGLPPILYLARRQRGARRAQEIAFVAEGAKWIWNLVEKYFANAVQIVDWHHASEYIRDAFHAASGQGDDRAKDGAQFAWTSDST